MSLILYQTLSHVTDPACNITSTSDLDGKYLHQIQLSSTYHSEEEEVKDVHLLQRVRSLVRMSGY